MFARGDRNLANLLETAYRLGCRRDGWSEYLRFDLWEKAFEQTGVNPADHLDPYPDPHAPLPWDWIDTGMPREWFLDEHRKALESKCTYFSCTGNCDECGVCAKAADKKDVHKESPPHAPPQLPDAHTPAGPSVRGSAERPAARLRLQYVKRHPASYLSHLETLTLFHRALRRSKLPIHYTGGEHPHPRVAFSPALPVGVESMAEYLDLWLSKMPEEGEVEKGLNAVLPEGISVLGARPVPLNASSLEQSIAWMEYDISFPEGTPQAPSPEDLQRAVDAFYEEAPCPEGTTPKEAKKSEDLRRSVKLDGKQDGPGLVCRIHRLSGSTPSAMRILRILFPSQNRNGLRPHIIKTGAALLPPSPPAPCSKRKLRHDK
jgi:radical SAM-linked protein